MDEGEVSMLGFLIKQVQGAAQRVTYRTALM